MSFDKGGGTSAQVPTSTSVTQTNLPEYAKPYYETMLGKAAALTDINQNPYPTYAGERIAGFDPMQTQAFTTIGGMTPTAQTQTGSDIAAYAAKQAEQYGGYQPAQAQNLFQAPGTSFIDPGMAKAYMSPYIQQALDPQLAEMQRQSDIAQRGISAQAARSGAFGGSRQALQSMEQERNKQQLMGQAVGQGYQTAYQQAQQAYQSDAARKLQEAQLGAQYGMQGLQLAEQSRQFGSNLGLQGIQQQLAAANLLGQLGQQQHQQQLSIASAQQQAGAQRQALAQQRLANQYQEWLNQKNWPYQQLTYMSNLMRGIPMAQPQVQTTYTAAPSVVSQLAGLGIGAAGISKALGAKEGGIISGYKQGGAVKGYAVGGLPDISASKQVAVNATRDELKKGLPPADPSIPPQLAGLLAAYKHLQENKAEAPNKTVLEDVLSSIQQAPSPPFQPQQPPVPGLPSLPTSPNMFRAAGGGIVAFQEGGYNPYGSQQFDEFSMQRPDESQQIPSLEAPTPMQPPSPADIEDRMILNRQAFGQPKPKPEVKPAPKAATPKQVPQEVVQNPLVTALTEFAGTKPSIDVDSLYEQRKAELDKLMPDRSEDIRKFYKEEGEKISKDANTERWLALAMGGFAMAAAKSPYALQNFGEGMGLTTRQISAVNREMRTAEDARKKAERAEVQANRLEQIGKIKDAEAYRDKQKEMFLKEQTAKWQTANVLLDYQAQMAGIKSREKVAGMESGLRMKELQENRAARIDAQRRELSLKVEKEVNDTLKDFYSSSQGALLQAQSQGSGERALAAKRALMTKEKEIRDRVYGAIMGPQSSDVMSRADQIIGAR